MKQARQFITHKKILIEDKITNKPSYQVSLGKEPSIKLSLTLRAIKKKIAPEKIKKETLKGEGL